MMIDSTGRGTMTPTSGGSTQRDLSVEQRDTVRLLLARISEKPVVPCTSTAHSRLQVHMPPAISGPNCAFPERQPEFHALTVLLEDAFNV